MPVQVMPVQVIHHLRKFFIGCRRQPLTCGNSLRAFPFHLLALLLMSGRPMCCFLNAPRAIHSATWLTESMSSANQKLTVEVSDYVNVMSAGACLERRTAAVRRQSAK